VKIAKIILPLIGNNGADLFMVHQHAKHYMLKNWGGYTSYETIGGWAGKNGMVEGEKAIMYEVAMPLADVIKLRSLASFIGYQAQQECVMIVTPNGDVEFVKPDSIEQVRHGSIG
jgi:hypothetical protein